MSQNKPASQKHNDIAPQREGEQIAIRAEVAALNHDPSMQDMAVIQDMSNWSDTDFFTGMEAGEDDKKRKNAFAKEGGQDAGWITVDGMDSVAASLDCNGKIIYTKEMSNVPEIRACYQTYLQKGDRKAYFACVRKYISEKVSKMDLDGGQLFLKSLGLDEKRDAQVRLCQQSSVPRILEVDIFGHVILPALLSGGIGALVLNNRCGRTMDRNEFYISTAAMALAGVTGTLLGNYFANQNMMR